MKVIVGLGNPGSEYARTKHNVGFMFVDALAEKLGIDEWRTKYDALVAEGRLGSEKILLVKPLTYMNLSGESIAPLAAFYRIPAAHVIVLCDDIAQAPGHIRIRPSGSAGGHNGLKSIIASLGTDAFYRIRIGVGEKPDPAYDLADWVLGRFPAADKAAVEGRLPDVEAAARLLMDGRLQEAQNQYNR